MVEGTLTIDDKVYTHPDDFEGIYQTVHFDENRITHEAVVNIMTTFTFNLPGSPTITQWSVERVINADQGGTALWRAEGDFILAGTGKFSQVEGFGTRSNRYIPPDYTQRSPSNVGFIKGWPL